VSDGPAHSRPEASLVVESRDEWALAIVAGLDSVAARLVTLVVVLNGLIFAGLTLVTPMVPLRTSLFVRWLVGVTVVISLAALLVALDALAPLRFELIFQSQQSEDWSVSPAAPAARARLIRYKAVRVRLAVVFFMVAAFTFALVLLFSLLWFPR